MTAIMNNMTTSLELLQKPETHDFKFSSDLKAHQQHTAFMSDFTNKTKDNYTKLSLNLLVKYEGIRNLNITKRESHLITVYRKLLHCIQSKANRHYSRPAHYSTHAIAIGCIEHLTRSGDPTAAHIHSVLAIHNDHIDSFHSLLRPITAQDLDEIEYEIDLSPLAFTAARSTNNQIKDTGIKLISTSEDEERYSKYMAKYLYTNSKYQSTSFKYEPNQ